MSRGKRICFIVLQVVCGFALTTFLFMANYAVEPNGAGQGRTNTSSAPTPSTGTADTRFSNISLPPRDYLVWSDNCRIARVAPYTPDILAMYRPVPPMNCSFSPRYVSKVYDQQSQRYLLHLNTQLKNWFVGNDDYMSCCLQEILRAGSDKRVKLSACARLTQNFVVPLYIDAGIVVCRSVSFNHIVSQDPFFFVQQRADVRQRLQQPPGATAKAQHSEPAFGVLLIGMDTMSQINFRRTMPLTFEHLQRHNWFELSGYNKIDDNTFPNLLAVLTGLNVTDLKAVCDFDQLGGLDRCNILFKQFRQHGFATAYAEDEWGMNTFNYLKPGFVDPPTDFYLHPFIQAAEQFLTVQLQNGMRFCLGPARAADYVYNFGLEFATQFLGERVFGLFWTNTITHNSYDTASGMDTRMREYFEELRSRGVLNDTVVIFFSDHGSRFGSLRNTPQGFLEERLPMFFMWLPERFQRQYAQFVYALKVNQHRLTSPFDVYLTLQHLMALATGANNRAAAGSCPSCHTLFQPVAAERTCAQAGIPEHWCTCKHYEAVSIYSSEMRQLAILVIKRINEFLSARWPDSKCDTLTLSDVSEANKKVDEEDATPATNATGSLYRLRFEAIGVSQQAEARPYEAQFEATLVHYAAANEIALDVTSVSRLNSYEEVAGCTNDKMAKKYCLCI